MNNFIFNLINQKRMMNNHTLFSTDKNYDYKKEFKKYQRISIGVVLLLQIVFLVFQDIPTYLIFSFINMYIVYYSNIKRYKYLIVELLIHDGNLNVTYLDRENKLHNVCGNIEDIEFKKKFYFTHNQNYYLQVKSDDFKINQYESDIWSVAKIIEVVEQYKRIKHN